MEQFGSKNRDNKKTTKPSNIDAIEPYQDPNSNNQKEATERDSFLLHNQNSEQTNQNDNSGKIFIATGKILELYSQTELFKRRNAEDRTTMEDAADCAICGFIIGVIAPIDLVIGTPMYLIYDGYEAIKNKLINNQEASK